MVLRILHSKLALEDKDLLSVGQGVGLFAVPRPRAKIRQFASNPLTGLEFPKLRAPWL